MTPLVVESRSLSTTRAIAAALFRVLTPPRIVLLSGDLGAGKTTFAKGFIGASGVDERTVKSPTYAIARTHGDAPPIHHLDLYRFDDESALTALGLEDLLHDPHALVLVEWASRMPTLLRDPSVVGVELTLRSLRVREIRVTLPNDLASLHRGLEATFAAAVESRRGRKPSPPAENAPARRKARTHVDR